MWLGWVPGTGSSTGPEQVREKDTATQRIQRVGGKRTPRSPPGLLYQELRATLAPMRCKRRTPTIVSETPDTTAANET